MSDYLDRLNPLNTNPVIDEIRAEAEDLRIPIIQPDAIHFIIQLIRLGNIRHVLEIGTANGYSSIMIATFTKAHVTTIERDHTMYQLAEKNIEKAGLTDRIYAIEADAEEQPIWGKNRFDMLFIDAAKGSYIPFFEAYTPCLNEKGVVICDNLLFHGMVDHEEKIETVNQAKLVEKIKAFNHYLIHHPAFDSYLYSIGDGLSVSIRKKA